MRVLLSVFVLCAGSAFSQDVSSPQKAAASPATPISAKAQQPPPKAPATPAPEKLTPEKKRAWELLERAYGLCDQLSDRQRVLVLSSVVRTAAEINPQKTQQWAEELLKAAQDAPAEQRPIAQMAAIEAVSKADTERALKYLEQLELPPDNPAVFNVPEVLATRLFTAVYRKRGSEALPLLRSTANTMARNSRYPYMAMGRLLAEIGSSNPELAEAIFREGYSVYQAASRSAGKDRSFSEFLMGSSHTLPADVINEALSTVVRSLLAHDSTLQPGMQAQVALANGSKVDIRNEADMAIFGMLPMLRRMSPSLYSEVIQARPQFQQFGDNRRGPWDMNVTFAASPDGQNERVAQVRQQMEIARSARRDPDRALAMTGQIADPAARADALAQIARMRNLGSETPKPSDQLLKQLDQIASEAKDKKTQLSVIVAKAETLNAAEKSGQVRELVEQGFELGRDLMRKEADDESGRNGMGPAAGMMSRLVRVAAKSDPDMALAFIESIPYPMPKAFLLVNLAQQMASPSFGGGARVTGSALEMNVGGVVTTH